MQRPMPSGAWGRVRGSYSISHGPFGLDICPMQLLSTHPLKDTYEPPPGHCFLLYVLLKTASNSETRYDEDYIFCKENVLNREGADF